MRCVRLNGNRALVKPVYGHLRWEGFVEQVKVGFEPGVEKSSDSGDDGRAWPDGWDEKSNDYDEDDGMKQEANSKTGSCTSK